MNSTRFDILDAATFGFRSAFAERRYLSLVALVPICITSAVELLKVFGLDNNGFMTELVCLIPISLAAAWFMFVQTRLLVFGERPPEHLIGTAAERRRQFEASALLWLLMQMFALGFLAFMLHWNQQIKADTLSAPVNIIGYLLIGATFWAARFFVAHILAATGYPLRDYIFRVNGVMVSLRLIALLFIVMLPVALVASPIEQSLAQALRAQDAHPLNIAGLIIVRTILNFVLLAVFNAACVQALRQMLGPQKPRKGLSV